MSTTTTISNADLLAAMRETNAMLAALVASLTPEGVSTTEAHKEATVTKIETKRAHKAGKSKKGAKASVADAPVRHLVRKNRADFVKAHPWAAGLSTGRIAELVVNGEQSCVEGWAIGERRTAMVTGEPAKKASKKAVVAKATASEPARPSTGAIAERRADGTITPKAEWSTRKALRESGLEPGQIDEAMAVLNA